MNALTTHEVMDRIEVLQAIQKQNPPTSKAWSAASDELEPLFSEMAHRQSVNARGLAQMLEASC